MAKALTKTSGSLKKLETPEKKIDTKRVNIIYSKTGLTPKRKMVPFNPLNNNIKQRLSYSPKISPNDDKKTLFK